MKQIISKELSARPRGGRRVITINDEPTKTQTQFKDETDVNIIMRKYRSTGQITHLSNKQGMYIDTENMSSYQEALHTVMKSRETFMQLPSEIRKRFQNDPQQLIDFLGNQENYEESIKLGLRNKKDLPEMQASKEPGQKSEEKV